MIHVTPINDHYPHRETGVTCWCNPRVEYKDPKTGRRHREPIVIHNSADGREAFDDATQN